MLPQSHIRPLLLICLLLTGLALRAHAAEANKIDRFEAARQTTIQWMQTRKAVNKTIREWSDQKQSLELTAELLNKEIGVLDGQIKKARDAAAGNKSKREELDANLKSRNELLDYAAKRIGGVETKIAGLARMFPPVLGETVEPLMRKFPKAGSESQIPVSQRLQNLLTVFNEIETFNAEFTVTPEMHVLNGTQVRVQVLYLGLAQAFYVSKSGRLAGVGRPGPDGWVWMPNNKIARDVTRAIRVFRDETVPSLVNLPVELK
ncbi:MAG: hypothetical protein CMO80_05100 [Verrucomicrobiales bacterium]|nr:hypothetical protein [Verrucomicrobiales bacterium]|tara:strand:- start:956 stop:1741 length:786 start_codon:yes stop_codon:yes gene_type:complete